MNKTEKVKIKTSGKKFLGLTILSYFNMCMIYTHIQACKLVLHGHWTINGIKFDVLCDEIVL